MLDWTYFNSFLILSTSFSTEELDKVFPKHTSRLLVQCTSAMLGGFTTTIITNPLDVCRARLQVPFKHLTRQYELFTCLDYNELVFCRNRYKGFHRSRRHFPFCGRRKATGLSRRAYRPECSNRAFSACS